MSESNHGKSQPIKKGTGYPVSLDRKPPTPVRRTGPVVQGNSSYPTSVDRRPSTTSTQSPKSSPKSTK